MKKSSLIIFALAALSFVTVSCMKEEAHQPGEADLEGCYGVYFPTQEASGAHTYDPTAPKEIEITVKRNNSKGDITVPCQLTSSVEGVFEAEDIVFLDGQSETTFKVTFDKIQTGVKSAFSVTLSDPQYVSQYSTAAISLDASILCVEWKMFLKPGSEEPAVFTFYEDWTELVHTCNVKYYEVNGVRYCQTVNTVAEDEDGRYAGVFAQGVDDEFEFVWYTKSEDPDDNNFVQFKTHHVGLYEGVADVLAYDYYAYWTEWNPQAALAGLDWMQFANKYADTYPLGSYDGNGIFHFYTYWGVPALGGGFGWFDIDLVADGFVRTDFTISNLEAGLTEDGVIPVYMEVGEDVDSVSLAIFAGELTPAQIANQVQAIAAGEVENALTVDEFTYYEDDDVNYAIVGITPAEAKTGKYTIVAVSFGEKEAKESKSVVATYVADDDVDKCAVSLSCGIGSAAKYPRVNTDNSLEVWTYGENIEEAKLAVFKKMDLASDMESCVDALLDTKSLNDSLLNLVNTTGLVTIMSGLLPGTEYYAMVWASNGYEEDLIMSPMSALTTGDPLPIYDTYTTSNYYGAGALQAKKDIVGKSYNLYAVNLAGSTGMREYMGKLQVADSETETEGPDDNGLYDEYVILKGLAGASAKKLGFDDSIEFDVYNGLIYSSSKSTVDGKMAVVSYGKATDGWYNATYCSAFIPVREGYYAFVNVSQNTTSLDLCGYGFAQGTSIKAAYCDYLLVDPAKDDNGVAPKNVAYAPMNLKVKPYEINAAKMAGVCKLLSRKNVTIYNSLRTVEGAVCPAVKASLVQKAGAPRTRVSVKDMKIVKARKESIR